MEAPQCQLQDFVDSFPMIAVSNTHSPSSERLIRSLAVLLRVPFVIAKFWVNDRESAINSALEFALFRPDLGVLVPVSRGIRPLVYTGLMIPDKIQSMMPSRQRLSAIAIAYL